MPKAKAPSKKAQRLEKLTYEFLKSHKDSIVIVADPATENIAVNCSELFAALRFTDPVTKEPSPVVSGTIRDISSDETAKVDKSIDQFLHAIREVLYTIGDQIRAKRKADANLLETKNK